MHLHMLLLQTLSIHTSPVHISSADNTHLIIAGLQLHTYGYTAIHGKVELT